MSKKEKDWTFVNDDGSVQIEQHQVLYAAAQGHNGTKKDSDSEQEFEVVASSRSKEPISSEFTDFKGICIKEDHFADDFQDDGSDIEVLNCIFHTSDEDERIDESEDKEIEDLLVSAYEKITVSDVSNAEESDESFVVEETDDVSCKNLCGSYFEKVDVSLPTDELVTNPDLNETMQNLGTLSELPDLYESDDDLDGLVELFQEKDDDTSEKAASSEASAADEVEARFHAEEPAREADDAIILNTSVFIILLCLSVIAGLFMGKGLSYVSISKNSEKMDASEVKSNELILEQRSNETDPHVIVFVNKSMHRLNFTTLWKSKNAKHHSFDIGVAYVEIQHKYQSLQRKYKELHQQYDIQKHVILMSKKKTNFANIKADLSSQGEKTLLKRDYPKICFRKVSNVTRAKESRSDFQKELLWWKMRTAVWRQKYLNLKVDNIEERKRLMGKRNATFKSCAKMLTQYFPDLNVSSSLKSNAGKKFTSSAKICWRKVLSPVEAVRNRMKDGFVYFGRNVDNAWETIKMKWEKNKKKNNNDEKEDVRGKLSSKWRKFQRVFSISNIVGSTFWRKAVHGVKKRDGKKTNEKLDKDGMVCRGKSDRVTKEFAERWSYDARREKDVMYLPPVAEKLNKMSLADADVVNWHTEEFRATKEDVDSKTDDVGGTNDVRKGSSDFKPCRKMDLSQQTSRLSLEEKLKEKEAKLSRKVRDLEERTRVYSEKKQNDLGILRDEIKNFNEYKLRKENDLEKKQEILVKKMRMNSNKYRNEQSLLRKKADEMTNVVKQMQREFQKLLADKMQEMKEKNKSLKKKIKSFKRKNEREIKIMKRDNKKLKAETKKKSAIIELKQKEMNKKLEKERETFVKWKDEEKEKLAREITEKWKKWNAKREDLVKKINMAMKEKRDKVKKKEQILAKKVDDLKKALSKLLREENEKFKEIRMKNQQLKQKQDQVELIRLFYTFGLRKEKEKHGKSREIIMEMKRKAVKFENLYKEILNKYSFVQEDIAKQRLKAKRTTTTFHQAYYPVVYCPDQQYCQGVKDEVPYDNKPPVVYCPRKDFCSGWGKEDWPKKDFININVGSKAYRTKSMSIRDKTTAIRPIPPLSHELSKINPFFMDLSHFGNETSGDDKASQKRKKRPALKPAPKKNGQWYFELMKERENQRGMPLSWYLYWSRGRENWRTSPGKKEDDNWYLRFMQERERQRSSPVAWYFKQNKQKEEEGFAVNNNWVVNRAKGREEAREKEGFYYCW